jgi:cellulose synthase/poly-beta-1,6-N-acetylglucosamine synthase-like glycosyltransferase
LPTTRPSAKTTWSIGQRIVVLALLIAAGMLGAKDAELLLWVVDLFLLGAFSLIVLVKLGSIIGGLLFHDMEDPSALALAVLSDEDLPVYSILVPMYREPGMVAPMVASLAKLDYPQEKLDVQLLLEADDEETQAAAADLPPWVRVIVAPDGRPKTKPRACNIGLENATGEFLVIFDAEDRPDPDQLKKAVVTFRRLPQVSCLQACLNYYNADQNLLTRWFTLEYTTWFDLFLPGLHSLGSPIPLGGTSNHFRSETLRKLGGWDAWNVTEDCDLGMQMAREGLETRVLNSTTWEEAVSRVPIWMGQRSRWVKGYWQTLLVHTRSPICGLLEFGPWKYLMMWLVVAGHVTALALLPFCWLRVLGALMSGLPIFHPNSPHTLYLYVATVLLGACNLLFIIVHCIAVWQRGRRQLWLAALGLPIYWLLMSWAAWKGILQHLWAPFLWEKTTHGMAEVADSADRVDQTPASQSSPQSRRISLLVIASSFVLILVVAIGLPRALNFQEAISRATLNFENAAVELEISVEENWQKQDAVSFHVALADQISADTTVFKAILHLKVGDGDWYQLHTEECVRDGDRIVVSAALLADWKARDSKQPWGPWCLRRVRAAGLKLYTHESDIRVVLDSLQLTPQASAEPLLTASFLSAFERAQQNTMLESRFTLSRNYKNPFDPREIDVAMEFVGPSGKLSRAIAFYFQDFDRHLARGKEILEAASVPEWRVRFTPREAGEYRWRLHGKDHHGDKLVTPWQKLAVAASDAPGFLRVDPDDHRFFSYENGDFFFPIGMNLRSPSDDIQPPDRDFPKPSPEAGTELMNRYLDQMGESGINVARIWMAPWFGGIEWNRDVPGYNGLGQYNLKHARQLDWMLDRARSHKIVVDLALQNHGPFASYYDMQWDENPYNHALGGPLKKRVNVLVDPEARRLFAQRFRYIAARWGSDPSIFAWTAWIEVDALRAPYQYVRSWHKDMIPKLNAVDLGRHPVSTLFAGSEGDPAVWEQPGISFTQIAAYAEYHGTVDRFDEVAEFATQFAKPIIIEEYGGSAVAGNMDMMAQQIHDGLWAGLMQPLAGAPYAWWWNLVFEKNLNRFHATAAKFVGDTDLRGQEWRYDSVRVRSDGRTLTAGVRQCDSIVWAWVYEDEQVNLRARRNEVRRGRDWHDIRRVHSRHYERLVGDRFDPLTATRPDRFDPVHNARFPLTGLKAGSYRIEFWETWGSNAVSSQTVEVAADGKLQVKLPPLIRDLAIRIVRE